MVRIITDSAADFEPRELENLNITSIPLTVTFADADYQENVNLSKDQFYDLLLNSGAHPKTSQASPQMLMDLFEQAHEAGDEAIYITISSAISGTYQNAMMTKNLLGFDTCHVLDSLNATGGQQLIVRYAAKLRDEGKTAAQIIAAIEDIRSRVVLFACIDTLEYLYKGGRISQTVYKLGTMANIKPIISVERDGSIAVPAKAMGMRKGVDLVIKKLETIPRDADFPLYVLYTDTRSAAETMVQKLKDVEGIIQVGAAIGSHVGPNACGLVYVAAK